jgi:radical SAM family RiPP maturation amino acid epimerase
LIEHVDYASERCDSSRLATPGGSRAAPADPIAYYSWMFRKRSAEDLALIGRAKRFRERFVADQGFREALWANPTDPNKISQRYGLPIAASEVRPLWDLSATENDAVETWPAARAWKEWHQDLMAHRDALRAHATTGGRNRCFDAWHRRQMLRTASELGKESDAITHPIVSFELSQGCSVGCWFCGISADRFAGYWPYTLPNRALWRDVLRVMCDLFGSAVQTGFCYWATDPADNPDYDKFIEDYYEITGWLPQTTTAAPLKNIALTRAVLRLAEQHRCVINRFSVLTLRALAAIHAEFTPEELLAVELVLHTKGSLVPIALAGRARERRDRLEAEGHRAQLTQFEWPGGTIACVSGFLVNMIERRVRLIAPCRPSDMNPLGYRILSEGRFTTAAEFRQTLETMVADHMPESLDSGEPVGFRSDLAYDPAEEYFRLGNGRIIHTVAGRPFTRKLGDLIAGGDRTPSEIVAELLAEGADVFLLGPAIQEMFDLGLIENIPRAMPV